MSRIYLQLTTLYTSLQQLFAVPVERAIGWFICTLVVILILRQILPSTRRGKLPPGPPGLPLIGNLLQLSEDAWLRFTEWKTVYGPIMYLSLAGQPVIVLNTLQSAADLLDRRAPIYSSRPRFAACNMLTEGLFLVFQKYGERWRRMRRATHEALHAGIVHEYYSIQTLEAAILVSDLVANPKEWEEHLRRMAGSTILSVVYDNPPMKNAQDPSLDLLDNLTNKVVSAGFVDGALIEYFPFLEHLPTIVAPWRKEALDWAPRFTKLFSDLYSTVKTRVSEGDTRPSISASMIEKQLKYDLNDKEIAWLVATLAVTSDTIAGSMAWFMLAMAMYPEAQKKAQEEIDAVVGRSRLPSFDDFENLVYVRAIIKETLRWHPVGPLGVQHRSTEDDAYEGYYIPKGSICIANIWAINRDRELWGPDADSFRPERHIGPDGKLAPSPADTKEEGHVTYGFGRRICVGRYLARNSLFLNMACILWMFNLKAPLGPDGKEIVCTEETVNMGLAVHPLKYEHRIEPRFPDALATLETHKALLGL